MVFPVRFVVLRAAFLATALLASAVVVVSGHTSTSIIGAAAFLGPPAVAPPPPGLLRPRRSRASRASSTAPEIAPPADLVRFALTGPHFAGAAPLTVLSLARGSPGGGGRGGGGKRRGGPGGGGPGAGKKKSKKKTGSGPGGKHRKTSNKPGKRGYADPKTDAAGSKKKKKAESGGGGGGGTSAKAKVALPGEQPSGGGGGEGGGSGKVLPPWKVMSAMDASRNVHDEIERRDRINRGEASASEDMGATAAGTGSRWGGVKKKASLAASSALLSPDERALLSWKRFRPDSVEGMAMVGAYLGKQRVPPLGCPEVAFLGRSNVGKSSLLNRLTDGARRGAGGSGAVDEARVGRTPGATASVNLYALLKGGAKGSGSGDANARKPLLGLADLPGFGYAKLSKETKASVEVAAERYLANRRPLALGVLLVDARRVPSDDDRAVLAALYDMGVPLVVVATKVDKLGKKEREGALEEVRDGLGLPDGQPLCVSSVTGEGTRELWGIVLDACEGRVTELRDEAEGKEAEGGDGEEDDAAEAFQDGEEVMYDQGYDWVHGYGDEEFYSQEDEVGGGAEDEDDVEDEDEDEDDEWSDQQDAGDGMLKLKDLKRIARKMERMGDV